MMSSCREWNAKVWPKPPRCPPRRPARSRTREQQAPSTVSMERSLAPLYFHLNILYVGRQRGTEGLSTFQHSQVMMTMEQESDTRQSVCAIVLLTGMSPNTNTWALLVVILYIVVFSYYLRVYFPSSFLYGLTLKRPGSRHVDAAAVAPSNTLPSLSAARPHQTSRRHVPLNLFKLQQLASASCHHQ